ncbi:MAG: chromate efflux transporter [Nitrospinota bacterium]
MNARPGGHPVPREGRAARVGEVARFFLYLGTVGFGGPMATIAMMEAETVERRRWVGKEEFLAGVALCQALPGPASTQVGIYLGYLRAGWAGAVVAGACFIGPAFLMLLGLSWAYFRFGALPAVGGLFYGLKPAVVAIILATCYRLGRSTVTDWKLGALLAASFALVYGWGLDIILLILLAGALGVALYGRPSQPGVGAAVLLAAAAPAAAGAAGGLLFLTGFFLKVGAFIYGGGYVIIPFIQLEVVEKFRWLTAQEFVDGLALGQLTPGPIVKTAAFIGYKVAGLGGAVAATFAIFFPSFVFVLLAAPFLARFREDPRVRAFLKGVNPAVVGAILAATVGIGRASLVDPVTWAWGATALVASLRFRLGVPWLVGGGAALGLLVGR